MLPPGGRESDIMLVFILALVILACAAEFVLTKDSLRDVKEDLRPEVNVAEPGQVFHLIVTLENNGRRYLWFLRFSFFLPEEIQPQDLEHFTPRLDGRGGTITCTTWLRPHQTAEFRIPVRIEHRGRYVFRPLTVCGGDFLGIREEKRRYERFREVVVAPRESVEADLSAVMGGFLGDCSVRRFLYEDPILTAGFREYTGQEPMKKISWAQSARGHGIMVKNNDYMVEPTMTVVLHAAARSGQQAGEFESCLCLARTVCRQLEDRRIPYDLCTNAAAAGGWYDEDGWPVPRGFGSAHFDRVLELLGRTTDTAARSDQAMLSFLAGEQTVRGRILITTASGMPEEGYLHRLRAASDGALLVLTPESSCGR